jgi:hypothetical protein
MAAALHLLSRGDAALALATIARQVEAGDDVRVALLAGAPSPSLPAGVSIRRVPDELSYGELLDEIYAADHVVAW